MIMDCNEMLSWNSASDFRGGIRDGDIIVKLNGMPLLTTSDLKEALTEETALLLEVRRGNDDLLFNIQPDVIMH